MRQIKRPMCPNPRALTHSNYKHSDNKNALIEASANKCMYCESKISHVSYGDVEHIKPKSKYPALQFDWDNLGYACSKCNNQKSDKFHEDTPYINPYSEDPKQHLFFSGTVVFPKNGCERGEITIRDIDLNRPSLLEKRDNRIQELQKAMAACYRTSNPAIKEALLNELREEANHDKEYSMLSEAHLKSSGL